MSSSRPTSTPYVPQPESLILPDGPIGEEAAELLTDLLHPHPNLVHDHDNEDDVKHEALPWYRTPSALWLLIILPFTSISTSATFAPRIEIYTQLVCAVHKPDIFESRAFTVAAAAASRCASDPTVQAEVAKLTTVITTCVGILACMTTGWWGAFSDRYGRTRVMGISVVGLLLTDFSFIFTTLFYRHLPGGYWFLVTGPLLEGCLGGFVTAVASMHAYLADTTTPATRSRVFSLSLGLIFTGMALGPTLGSLLIHATGRPLTVFYAAASGHLVYALLIWLLVPESRPRDEMRRSRAKYAAEAATVGFWNRAFAFLSPLAVFWPAPANKRSPLKARRDWGLVLIAVGYGLTISIMGSYTFKFQYAAAVFGWSSETIGYWISLVGAARAVFLTLILPVVIKLFNPSRASASVAPPPPVSSTSSPASSSSAPTEIQPLLSPQKGFVSPPVPPKHSPLFDLRLAQVSLLIEFAAYTFMALAPTARTFTLASLFGAMGAGFSPAVQTVALGMYLGRERELERERLSAAEDTLSTTSDETEVERGEVDMHREGKEGEQGGESGRLFGALSVVQALCSQILGPAMYGLVYMKTAGTFPRAIFFVSVVTVALAAVMLAGVRVGRGRG